MKWTKLPIKMEDVPSIEKQGRAMAQAGNPLIEQLRCVFTLENDKTLYVIPLLDYIDNIPESPVTSFNIYQRVA